MQFDLSAPDEQPAVSEGSMKKVIEDFSDDLRPEYDFASMKGGVRGKYAKHFRAGTTLVLLDPEVAQAFPNAAAVNDALRAVLHMKKVLQLPAKPRRTSSEEPRRKNSSKR